ncbi:hypothetical protein L6164_032223 [Bauhinia variegata]|uniref:Uncharacterized protein n=1 Tax=Bauhinia variegata TaxID=167791 RepID=A0ACB9KNG5_BAUVA|nr:hypothetical protein L6164_032223 [Bauhinia variegata]
MEPSESRQALQEAGVREFNHFKSNVDLTHQTASEISELHTEVFEASNQALEIDADINTENVMNVELKDQPGLDSEVAGSHLELYDDGTGDMQLTEAEEDSISVDAAFRENLPRLVAVDLPQHMLIYVLLFLLLIAAATFNYSRKDNGRSAKVASPVEQPQLSQTLHMSVPKEQISLDKPSLRNGPTEMDVLGESCPSEMSSFQKSSSYVRREIRELDEAQSTEMKTTKNNRTESLASSDYSMDSPTSYVRKEARELNEAQSIEKKSTKRNRRESLASSDYSLCSSPTSYGSFTTYEKVPNKHRHGDENTVTPVRRSSRIRNQATSPL